MGYVERADAAQLSSSSSSRRLHEARYEFAGTLELGERVLDCACGTGYGSRILSLNSDRSVVGVDISEEAVSEARRSQSSERVEFRIADASLPGQLPGPFSAIVSFETIEHVPQPDRVLANFAAALEPGGILVISTPNGSVTSPIRRLPPPNPFHLWEESIPGFVRRLEKAGFAVRESYGQEHLSRNTRFLYRLSRGRGQILARGPLAGLEARMLGLESALARRLQPAVVDYGRNVTPSVECPLHTYVYQLHVCERIRSGAPGHRTA